MAPPTCTSGEPPQVLLLITPETEFCQLLGGPGSQTQIHPQEDTEFPIIISAKTTAHFSQDPPARRPQGEERSHHLGRKN